MDQGEIERRATGYIRQLSFDLARQELELLTDRRVRDSLHGVLDRAETFADAHLIYVVDAQRRKKYMNGRARIAYYLEHGFISSYEDDTSLILLTLEGNNYSQSEGRDYVPRDMVEIHNLSAYPRTTDLEISGAQLERLDLRGLPSLRKLVVKGAKDGLIIDASDSPLLREIQLTGTPNLGLRLHPSARPKLIVSGSYFASLQSLAVEQASSLYLDNVRLRDIDLLGKVSRTLTTLDISVEAGDTFGSDGLRYRPLPFDDAFITKLNGQLPTLKTLRVLFAQREDFDKASFEKLNLPALEELSLRIRSSMKAVPHSAWG